MHRSTWSPWFLGTPMGDGPELRLFCLHHAGAGASAYREWQDLVGSRIEVVPVQLPGREGRFTEPAERSIRRLTDRLIGPIVERAAGRPFAFFGHSMGALLAHDLSVRLTTLDRTPAYLVVSGYEPPHVRTARDVHTLPDEEFLAHVLELEGTLPDILANRSLLELLLPVLRDDFTACETYEYADVGALTVPLAAFGGDRDPGVSPANLRRWADLTAGPVTVEIFPGGHFYLADQLEKVVNTLLRTLGVTRDRGAMT